MSSKTKLQNLVDPEVMADMISAELPQAIKFAPIARIDTKLEGVPGDTITIPKYEYIGDAEDMVEGEAMDISLLTTTTTQATIKQAGKGIEITDKSVLCGYGDPVGEGTNQIKLSIASKIDNDFYNAILEANVNSYDGSSAVIGYDGVVNAVDLFEDEDADEESGCYMFVHPNQVTQLRLDEDFKDASKYPMNTIMTGVVGMIAGCEVVKSKRIKLNDEGTAYQNVIVKDNALALYLKRDVDVEDDRDITTKTTIITGDTHYVAVVENDSRAIKVTFKK